MPLNMDIPRSGLTAAERRQSVSAHNVANLDTDGGSLQRTLSAERPYGGVSTRVDTVALSEDGRRLAVRLEGPQNNVDASIEAVNRISARNQHAANGRALRSQDGMLVTALDILA